MATFQSPVVETGNARVGVGLTARTATYEATASLALNDVIEMIPVYAGETVLGLEISADDLDSGAGLILDVGDVADDDRFISNTNVGQAGGIAKHTLGCPYTYTVDDTIDISVSTAAAGAQAGTLTITAYIVK